MIMAVTFVRDVVISWQTQMIPPLLCQVLCTGVVRALTNVFGKFVLQSNLWVFKASSVSDRNLCAHM